MQIQERNPLASINLIASLTIIVVVIVATELTKPATTFASQMRHTTLPIDRLFPMITNGTHQIAGHKRQLRASGSTRLEASCDLLLQLSDNLADYCHCKDSLVEQDFEDDLQPLNEIAVELAKNDNNETFTAKLDAKELQVSQLDCTHNNLIQIQLDLSRLINSDTATSLGFTQIKIDHLNVVANLSHNQLALVNANEGNARLDELDTRVKRLQRLRVDYVSLQLIATDDKRDPIRTESRLGNKLIAENQMIDFIGQLIDETKLRSLAIYVEPATSTYSQRVESDKNDGAKSTLSHRQDVNGATSRFWAKLINLSRLELSFRGLRSRLVLGPNIATNTPDNVVSIASVCPTDSVTSTAQHNSRLEWLNLASNEQLELQFNNRSNLFPFARCASLKFLSLESCNLHKFQLFSMFTYDNHGEHVRNQETSNFRQTIRRGQASLASLNLANNLLSSFEQDLFTMAEHSDPQSLSARKSWIDSRRCKLITSHQNRSLISYSLHFPALIQLDLSRNQLSDITIKAGQLILCSMPNLNQLYLQHNKLAHLNLNSMLVHPSPLMSIMETNSNLPDDNRLESSVSITSRLEYLDLSYNQLERITTWRLQQTIAGLSMVRIKSINLAHNNLEQLIDPRQLDESYLNKLIFSETYDSLNWQHQHQSMVKELSWNYLSSFVDFEPTGQRDGQTTSKNSINTSSKLATICDYLSPASSNNQTGELLNELIINNNRLFRLSGEVFASKQCANIQSLKLNRNLIRHIEVGSFDELSQLEHLDLSANQVVSLDGATFRQTYRLKSLDLSENRLKVLDKGLLSPLIDLEELLLNGNKLVELPRSLFSSNMRLTALDLADNDLHQLEMSLFSNLKQLRALNLLGNRLQKFAHNYLFGSKLQPLNRDIIDQHRETSRQQQQQQQSVQTNKRQPQTSSKRADTNKNTGNKRNHQLKSKTISNKDNKSSGKQHSKRQVILNGYGDQVNVEISPELVSSNALLLSSNQLISFQMGPECDDSMQFVQEIQSLWLDHNKLQTIDQKNLQCLKSLQTIHLQSNLIESLDSKAFHSMLRLEYINLSDNKLIKINSKTFSWPSSRDWLRHVNLANNQLTGQLDLLEVFGCPNLGLANKSNDETLTQGSSQLEELILSFNPNLRINGREVIDLVTSSSLKQLEFNSIDAIQWNFDQPLERDTENHSIVIQKKHWQPKASEELIEIGSLEIQSIRHIDESFFASLEANPLIRIRKFGFANVIKSAFAKNITRLVAFLQKKLQQQAGEALELDLSQNLLNVRQSNSILEKIAIDRPEDGTISLQLISLNLSSNLIDQWPIDSNNLLSRLMGLKLLDLSQNKLKYLIRNESANWFELSQLETLSLNSNAMIGLMEHSNNRLGSLGALMPNLKYLDLSNNRLTWIPFQFFDQLDKLIELKLNWNQLENFAPLVSLTVSNRDGHGLLTDLSFNDKLKLVGNNRHYMRDGDTKFQLSDTKLLVNDTELVLISTPGRNFLLDCKPIDDYVRNYADNEEVINKLQQDISIKLMSKAADRSGDDEDADKQTNGSNHGKCKQLVESIHVIQMRSLGQQQFNLDSIDLVGLDRLYYLDLMQNKLTKLLDKQRHQQSSKRQSQVIGLNLSENRLRQLPIAMICFQFLNLKQLILANNHIDEIRLGEFSLCENLNQIDLSHNKLSLIDMGEDDGQNLHSLRILKLNNNQLSDLSQLKRLPEAVGSSLRLLDVRSNNFKTFDANKLVFMPKTRVIGLESTQTGDLFNNQLQKQLNQLEPFNLRLMDHDNSLAISWQGNSNTKYDLSIAPDALNGTNAAKPFMFSTTTILQNNRSQMIIRFCHLRQHKQPIRLCLIESSNDDVNNNDHHLQQQQLNQATSKCFFLKLNNGTLCLTNLEDSIALFGHRNINQHQLEPINEATKFILPQGSDNSETSTDSSQLISFLDKRNVVANITSHKLLSSNSSIENEDPVLNLIEYIKTSWLKLKEINLNDYLTAVSSIQNDSIWITLNDGKYPIYTLTMVKVAIVLASLCIIVLLIAMFALLSYLSRPPREPSGNHYHSRNNYHSEADTTNNESSQHQVNTHQANQLMDSPRSESEEMITDRTNDTLGTMTTTRTSNTTTTTGTSATSGGSQSNSSNRKDAKLKGLSSSAATSGIKMKNSSGSRLLVNQASQSQSSNSSPIVEGSALDVDFNERTLQLIDQGIHPIDDNRNNNLHQLDPNQLILLQQHSQQPCSTPSLSLAPSSVETAETMQAVDSIQSGPSSCFNNGLISYQLNQHSVDQYGDDSNQPTLEALTCHNNPPIATVMRMVKSNSTSGFGDNNYSSNEHQASNGTLKYRTINQSRNYSETLKSKIRAIQERHNQIYPKRRSLCTSGFYNELNDGHNQNQGNTFHQLDYNRYFHNQQQSFRTLNGSISFNQDSSDSAIQLNYQHQEPQKQLNDMDPSTLSLLSINTALSSNHLGKSSSTASQQVSPTSTTNILNGDYFNHDQPNQSSSNMNLCHYHKLIQDQPNEILVTPTGIILEQDEEHQYSLNDLLVMDEFPPPPPDSAQ